MKKTNKEELKGNLLIDIKVNNEGKEILSSEGNGNLDVLLTLLTDAFISTFNRLTKDFSVELKEKIKVEVLHTIKKLMNENFK